jgi:hypothetical protein
MLDQCRIAGVHKAPGQAADQPDRPVCQPSRSAPASEVIVPPSNPVTTTRFSTAPKSTALRYILSAAGAPQFKAKLLLQNNFL